MIFKPKIKTLSQALQVLKSVPLLLVVLLLTFSINTLQTHADMEALAKSYVDSIGTSNSGGTQEVQYGVAARRTGYLCYLLDKQGNAVPGTGAVALKSPNFEYHSTDVQWHATSRKGGYIADGFSKDTPVPWNLSPWNPPPEGSDNCVTNEPQIRAYFESVDGNGVQKAFDFVDKNWGIEMAHKLGNDEVVLVIETLMHFKFSVAGNGQPTEFNDEYYEAQLQNLLNRVDNKTNTEMMKEADAYGIPFYSQWLSWMDAYRESGCKNTRFLDEANRVVNQTKQALKDAIEIQFKKAVEKLKAESQNTSSGKWIPIGDFVIGTVPELLKYERFLSPDKNLDVFDSYLNKVAPFAERIKPGDIGEKVGFTAWRGGTSSQLTDQQVQEFGVAMMVISAKNSAQTTCDEPQQPSPHKAPVESTGTTTIIKNYRTKDTTTNTLTDDGCFTTSNLGNQITIENERDYQVVGWATSSSTSTIDSITWSVPSALRSGTTSSTIKLDSTEKCLYVLLEKTETPPPEPPAEPYNYKLTESSITRRVHFTAPDNRLTLPYIENHTFKWIIPAHQTSCPGNHPFTDACHGQHIGPHTASCEKGCPATCTQEHPSGSHIESCSDPHYYDCGTRCQTQYASCSGWQWHEKQLKLSINNTQQSNYPDILATKSGWNTEPQNSKLTKHYYLNDASFERTSTSSQSYQESNWDYVAVLLRGKDKLTIAHWQNAGSTGNGLTTAANTDLQDVSSSGFTIANTDSGTRKTQDYMETFNTYFNTEESEGVDNYTYYKSTIHATVPAPDTPRGSTLCGINQRKAYISNPLSINNIKVRIK